MERRRGCVTPASPRGRRGRLPEHAEPLRLDPQRHVELAAEILERDDCGQLDDLRLVEVGPEPREELVAHALRRDGHGLRVLERRALHLREAATLPPRRHLADLVLVRPRLHPPGCVDVDSEGAAVDDRDAEVDERHEGSRQPPGLLDGGRELFGRRQDRRAVGKDLRGVEETAEELALLGEDLLEDGIAAVVLDLAHSRHGVYLIRAAWSARSLALARVLLKMPASGRARGSPRYVTPWLVCRCLTITLVAAAAAGAPGPSVAAASRTARSRLMAA